MDNNKKKSLVKGAALVLCVASLGMGAMSYFTDLHDKTVSTKAGSFDMALEGVTTDLSNGLSIINPGDSNPFTFTIRNAGEKSMDVKNVVTIDAGSAVTSADSEYKLLDKATGKEITEDLNSKVEGSQPLATKVVSGNTITYTFVDQALAGSVEKDNVQDGSTVASHKYDLQFKMDEDSKNAFAGKPVSVKIESYAKQHRNTQSANKENWHKDKGVIKAFETVGTKTVQ